MGVRSTIAFALAVVAVAVVVFIPAFNDGGPEMDEGTLVAYPSLVSEGHVPMRDFETFYGPAEPYVVAAAGSVFGHSVGLERAAGLLMRIIIALAVFALVAPLGRWIGLGAAVASMFVLLGLGLQALAILGAIAGALAALALLALRAGPGSLAFGAAGLCTAAAIAFRPDIAPAALLSAAPLVLWRSQGHLLDYRSRKYLLLLGIGLAPLVLWLAIVGADQLSRVAGDLAASRDGRHLPLPGLGSAEGQILLAAVVLTVLNALAAILLLRRDRYDERGRVMAAIAVLLVLLAPSALQRADSAHILPFAAIAIGLSPLTAEAMLKAGVHRIAAKVALAGCALIVAIGFTHQAGSSARAQARSLPNGASEVAIGDRSFPLTDSAAAGDLQRVLDELVRISHPGQSLFVGPADLSRTNYADTFVYFLLPDLEPASFYTEVNPGTSNADDSTLPEELAAADFAVLTERWDEADTEGAAEPGSDAAANVLDRDFCLVTRAGTYSLYEACANQQAGG